MSMTVENPARPRAAVQTGGRWIGRVRQAAPERAGCTSACTDDGQDRVTWSGGIRAAAAGATRLLPGVLLCAVVTIAAVGLEHVEARMFSRVWLEALVLAILVGMAVRTAWRPQPYWQPGVAFCAKRLLEVAVVLLGASVSTSAVLAIGPALLCGIAIVVALAIMASYGLCRLLGLPRRMAILVACGNSICGNSAIAAVAPVIGATADEIAASIAFTAVLGVLVILGLPLLVPALGLSHGQFGVLAGLTVYAVPQVLAATAPVGAVAMQVGTLVKLVRVLMLGPVVLTLSLLASRLWKAPAGPALAPSGRARQPIRGLIPWFIIGFLALAALRSAGLIPDLVQPGIGRSATVLTVISMAALGLGVDVRTVARAGGRVAAAVTLSLLAIGAIGLGLIHLIGVA